MRVSLVSLNYAPEPTGIAPYSTGLAEGLAARNHDVQVITGIPHYPEWRNYTGVKALRSISTINGVQVTRVRHYVPAGGTGARRALLEASFAASVSVVPWGKPDVVVAVSPSLASASVARLRTCRPGSPPLVVWVQDLYSRGVMELNGEAGIAADAVRRYESRVVKGAAGVVVIQDRFADFVNGQLGVPRARIREIRNWSHVRFHDDPSEAAALRQRYGWGDRPVALHCGSMGVKQGLEAVVAAARQAEAERRRLLFVLMGDGSQRPKLEALAQGCANLQLLPPLPGEEFEAALQAANVLLLNELRGVREMALPSKLTTYFTAGKPVVAAVAADGTSADEIRAAEAGVIVTPGDTTAMLSTIENLLAQPERAAELGRSGQRYAAETLSFEGVMGKWEELLSDVIGQHATDPTQQTIIMPATADTAAAVAAQTPTA